MPKTLVAHEQPVSRIFSDDYVFSIPGYQRPYAWTTEQARELLDDLTAFMQSNPGEVSEMLPYFLGSIVLIKEESTPNADVVDGQQRLTTLTILLSAIRARIASANAAYITPLIYERGNPIRGTQDRFRLSLRERDREFLQRYVQREGGIAELLSLNTKLPDSQRNIQENVRLYEDRLKNMAEPDCLKLAQFIVTRCFLVVVATPDLDSAYRIFSVLNSRGLDLAATDILKAEIIGEITEAKRAEYTKKWEEVEEDLGRDTFGELFSHIRMVYRKAKPQGTLLKEFKDHVSEIKNPVAFIDSVLLPMASAYEELVDASYSSTERAETVNGYLKWLNRLEFKDWVPPALAFTIRWRHRPERMGAFFKDMERLSYSMLVRRSGINDRIERFSKLSAAIEANNDLSAEDSPLQLDPFQQDEVYSALAGPVYDTFSARACSALLVRLDALLSGGGASYDYNTITVEHVLPQQPDPGSEWLTWFSEQSDRIKWVHRLGNLALLTRKKNSSARNFSFDRKKNSYFSKGGVSPFVLTTQVLQHSQWTPDIVEKRQNELLSILEEHWRLENRKNLLDELL